MISQKYYQIYPTVHAHLKTDNVDYLEKPLWKNVFFHIFAIHSSSRHEKRCQMSVRRFSLVQGSRNQQCACNKLYSQFYHKCILEQICWLTYANFYSFRCISQWLKTKNQAPNFFCFCCCCKRSFTNYIRWPVLGFFWPPTLPSLTVSYIDTFELPTSSCKRFSDKKQKQKHGTLF